MSVKQQLLDYGIRKRKPYSDKTIISYMSNYKKLNDNKEVENVDFLDDMEIIEEKLNEMKLNTRKTYLIAVCAILRAREDDDLLDFYEKLLEEANKEYNILKETKILTDTENKNWTTLDKLKEVRNFYEDEVSSLGDKILRKQLFTIQKYMVASLYTLIPPIRCDYINMSIIKNIDEDDEQHNFLLINSESNKYFILNDFKTKSTYGKQKIPIPEDLNKVINFWLKYNNTGFFLINTKYKPLDRNSLSKLIVSTFLPTGKHITLNLLRKIWVSSSMDGTSFQKSENLSKQMLHNTLTAYQNYYKVVQQ
tara:strand:+ start:402 stop:1325 length:924 start_codon:yes stop_codon:yes gene_type:complete